MQRELAQTLGGHCHHTGIVRTGGDLVEQNRAVGEHEQFHAEYAPTGFAGRLSLGHQAFNGGTCDVARPLGLTIGFGSRLPGLAVIAGLLTLADRRARHNAGGRRNSQYRQLTLQRSKRLNDHARHIALIGGAAALLRFGPSGIDGVGGTHHRLAVTRRAHHRLDHARIPTSEAPARSSSSEPAKRYGVVGKPNSSWASTRRRSRSMQIAAISALGTTWAPRPQYRPAHRWRWPLPRAR
mgnify:CR=1 FL=1